MCAPCGVRSQLFIHSSSKARCCHATATPYEWIVATVSYVACSHAHYMYNISNAMSPTQYSRSCRLLHMQLVYLRYLEVVGQDWTGLALCAVDHCPPLVPPSRHRGHCRGDRRPRPHQHRDGSEERPDGRVAVVAHGWSGRHASSGRACFQYGFTVCVSCLKAWNYR